MEMLGQAGFDVRPGTTGLDGVEVVRSTNPAVVTLSVGLPDIDGYEVLRRIRQFSDCYIIMLSARADEYDTLTALQAGADDYVLKPFKPRELRARIDALLRRPRTAQERVVEQPSSSTSLLTALPSSVLLGRGELSLDCGTRIVKVGGQLISLTKSEFDLLHELLRSDGAVRTKSDLVNVVWDPDGEGDPYTCPANRRAVDVHVGNLRRKLSQYLGDIELITTIRGVGYRIAP